MLRNYQNQMYITKLKFKKMIKVILESPFAGNIERNIRYARACVRDSLLRGESPIASHLLYTQSGILNDNIEEERKLGIDAGLSWHSVMDKHVFYIDYGYSNGMLYAKKKSEDMNIQIEERYLYNECSSSDILQQLKQNV